MSAFEREFKVQNLIKLEQNYRSHGHILDTANVLIANNAKRLGKNLFTDAGHGEQIRIFESSRSEEHTSELQSLMRISYAVFCMKKKKIKQQTMYKQHK